MHEKVECLSDLGNVVHIKTNTSTYEADKVILTIPPRLAAQIQYKPALFGSQEGGYLEGALLRAQEVVKTLI